MLEQQLDIQHRLTRLECPKCSDADLFADRLLGTTQMEYIQLWSVCHRHKIKWKLGGARAVRNSEREGNIIRSYNEIIHPRDRDSFQSQRREECSAMIEHKRRKQPSHKTRTPEEIAAAEIKRKEKERRHNETARERRRAANITSDTTVDPNTI